MAVNEYQENEQTFYRVYVNVRSKKDPGLRVQKTLYKLKSKRQAEREEKRLFKEALEEINDIECRGLLWGAIVRKWEEYENENTFSRLSDETVKDYLGLLRKWSGRWMKVPANQIGIADSREVLRKMEDEGKSYKVMKTFRNVVHRIYLWGLEERLILGVNKTPMEGLNLTKKTEDKLPEILTLEQMKTLLYEAKKQDHPWYSVWAFAILTGMRNGELYALKWSKVDFENGIMRVDESYNTKTRTTKSTKAGYWRNVPISSELKEILIVLQSKTGETDFVLPRSWQWDRGMQASILRSFCKEINIPSIKFHTLRACFATQLLADGVSTHKVMAAGGWRETKTMDIYSRLSGVDVKGATESLKVLPKNLNDKENVVQLFSSDQ